MLADSGDTMVRWAYNIYWADSINQVVPATTNSAYEAAMSAGCPSGSVCDPNTWAWGDDSEAQTVFQEANGSGFTTMTIMGDTTPWNSVNGTNTGLPTDWTVYEDMVKKIVQHYSSLFATAYIEVWNEPDLIPISPSDYATVYYHTAHAIRSLNAFVQIGGPVTSSPNNTYVDAIMNNPSIPRSWVNFISFHNYNGGVGPEDTSVMNYARSFQANEPIFLTEWNADGSCQSSLDANDPVTVAYDGARLINILSANYNGATHHTFEIFGRTGLCSVWDTTGSYLLSRMRAPLLLSKKMGLGAGNSSIKQVSMSGVTHCRGGGEFRRQSDHGRRQLFRRLDHRRREFYRPGPIWDCQPANLSGRLREQYCTESDRKHECDSVRRLAFPIDYSHTILCSRYHLVLLASYFDACAHLNISTDAYAYLNPHAWTDRHLNDDIRTNTQRDRHFYAYCWYRSANQGE
jgi:hypothetical protein